MVLIFLALLQGNVEMLQTVKETGLQEELFHRLRRRHEHRTYATHTSSSNYVSYHNLSMFPSRGMLCILPC